MVEMKNKAQAQINIRTEEYVKKQAEKVCNELGISLSSAINIYLKKLGRESRIPFEVSIDPFYNKDNIDYLEKKLKKYKKGNLKMVEKGLIDED
jgi:DNA-damage-inducible protein J